MSNITVNWGNGIENNGDVDENFYLSRRSSLRSKNVLIIDEFDIFPRLFQIYLNKL